MYSDVIKHCTSCPQCGIIGESGRVSRPPLHPIPVQRPFQIMGIDIIDLRTTEVGNKYVVVIQDFNYDNYQEKCKLGPKDQNLD